MTGSSAERDGSMRNELMRDITGEVITAEASRILVIRADAYDGTPCRTPRDTAASASGDQRRPPGIGRGSTAGM